MTGVSALVTQAPPDGGDFIPVSSKTNGRASTWCRCLRRGSCEEVAYSAKVTPIVPTETVVVTELSEPAQQEAEELLFEVPPDLPPQEGTNVGRKTLVLDLDETLVHSSFCKIRNPDIVITIELEGEFHEVYVRKRPGVDEFLLRVAEIYEIVVYTASMAKYANPLLDKLDRHNVVTHRLFREACTRVATGYAKDMSKLGRRLQDVIIIDNSPTCYSLQPNNGIPIKTWRDDTSDRELVDLTPILASLAEVKDIPAVLRQITWAADEEEQAEDKKKSRKRDERQRPR